MSKPTDTQVTDSRQKTQENRRHATEKRMESQSCVGQ